MLAAMADGTTQITNFATAADCHTTLGCLENLDVKISIDGTAVIIQGVGKRGFRAPVGPLDCGNSGTTMRLIAGILAGQNFDSILTGDASLTKRPMKRIIEPLLSMGAKIESVGDHAPLHIYGYGEKHLNGVEYKLNIASAQIKSCILLTGLFAVGRTTVIEPIPTRDHTERMLRWLGVDVREENLADEKRISVSGDQILKARDIDIPGDISSAAFFIVAAACLPDSSVEIENVGLNPTRNAIFDVLRQFGVDIKITNERLENNEPVGDLAIDSRLDSANVGCNILNGKLIANILDEIPILAVFGTQIDGGLEIRDASELRVKESDRIAAIVENLRRMNADVEEFPDGFRVAKSELNGAEINSYGDHRIAMAFAVAGLFAKGDTKIIGAECADISFPGFFETLKSVVS